VDLLGDASDFTDRKFGSPQVPFHPHSVLIIGHDVRKERADSFAVTRRPCLLRLVPRGWASGGAKVERNPSTVHTRGPVYAAGDVGVRTGGGTGPLRLPKFSTTLDVRYGLLEREAGHRASAARASRLQSRRPRMVEETAGVQ
jgi:hypothetical protein